MCVCVCVCLCGVVCLCVCGHPSLPLPGLFTTRHVAQDQAQDEVSSHDARACWHGIRERERERASERASLLGMKEHCPRAASCNRMQECIRLEKTPTQSFKLLITSVQYWSSYGQILYLYRSLRFRTGPNVIGSMDRWTATGLGSSRNPLCAQTTHLNKGASCRCFQSLRLPPRKEVS